MEKSTAFELDHEASCPKACSFNSQFQFGKWCPEDRDERRPCSPSSCYTEIRQNTGAIQKYDLSTHTESVTGCGNRELYVQKSSVDV